MKPRAARWILLVTPMLGCGGNTLGGGPAEHLDAMVKDSASVATSCIPGQSVACVGPGGCSTNQVCSSDGESFGACTCASKPDASGSPCAPGQSIACAGPGGCVSRQVCNSDGAGYGACVCQGDGGTSWICIPGQSIACGGPFGCSSSQVCNDAGSGYGSCDCPDASGLPNDAGELPDGYAPIPPSLGRQGYNAIWAVNPFNTPSQGWIFRPLFATPDCAAVPPYGDSYVALFKPTSAGPSGTPCARRAAGGPRRATRPRSTRTPPVTAPTSRSPTASSCFRPSTARESPRGRWTRRRASSRSP